MNCIEFEITAFPRDINPDAKLDWESRARLSRNWKSLVVFAVGMKRPASPFEKALATVAFYSPIEPVPRDMVSLKAHLLGGLIFAHVIKDADSVKMGYSIVWMRGDKPRIKIIVEELNHEKDFCDERASFKGEI